VFAGLSKSLANQFAALQNLFSDINLQNIKEGIDKFVAKAVAQFQKVIENPEVILYLLYMFCKTSSFIESSLKSPVQSYQSMVGNIETEQNLLRIKSAPRTQAAIEAGRPVATQESIDRITTQAANSHNAAVSNEITGGNQLPSQVSYVHTQENLNHPHWSSWSNLGFEDSVVNNSFWKRDINVRMTRLGGGIMNPKNMGFSTAVGYYKCELKVLEMMNEVGRILGKKLIILSAYRDPVYNEWLHNTGHATAKGSQHMVGKALDVRMGGVDRTLFLRTCQTVGFTGFGWYSSFIHADIGGARGRSLLIPGVYGWRG
jgi:hypothetical protein